MSLSHVRPRSIRVPHERPAASPADAPQALLRPLLGGALALAVAVGIGRFAYTPILPAMQRAAHLSTVQAGLLASANYLGYLTGALLAALAMPRAVRQRALGACLAAVVLTTGLMAAASSLAAWGALRLVSGVASAAVFVLASGLVLDLLWQRRSPRLAGWLYSGVGLGIVATGAVVRLVDGALGWPGDWLALALLAALLAAASWRWLPPALPVGAAVAPGQRLGGPGRRAALALLLAAYLLEGTGYVVTGTFLVAIVNDMPGLGGAGPSVWVVVGLAAAPSCLAWAWAAGRAGHTRALVAAYLAQACGIVLPVVWGGLGTALAAAVLFGGTFMGITTLTLTLGGRLAQGRSAGLVGLLTATFGLGQIVGPTLAGVVAERAQGFAPALLAAAALVLLGGLLMAALPWAGRQAVC